MEKLPMCRICLVENVRMYVVVNRNLHKLYEKLTDIPFVTEDIRPILACFFCCTKLKQCYQLLTQCLEAEELFAQRMTEDYEINPVIIQDHYRLSIGLVKSPIEHISIVDEFQTESIDIKEELPAVSEGLDDIIEPKEEHESDDLEQENLDEICLDVADTPPRHSESDLEDDGPLLEFKIEDEEVPKKERRAREMIKATVAKKPKHETLKTKLENAITAEQTEKEKSSTQDIRITQIDTSNLSTYFIEPYKFDQRNFNQVKKSIHHSPQIGEKHKCGVCQCSFSHKGNLTKHIRIHTGEKPYKCNICQRSFSEKGSLNQHIRVHTGEKPYNCNVCQRSFREKVHLTKHIRIHTGEKPYKCDVCQQSFSVKISLTNHIRKHTGEKPYECNVCQHSFSAKSTLNQHIRIHTGEKPYNCDVCHRSFTEKGTLTKHSIIHSGEKPYKCNVCNQSFNVKISLIKHIRIHTGEKPFKCNVCQCSFREKAHLTKHIRIHTGEKPFKCDVCQKSFSVKSSLTKHILIHTGEKPYECNVCQHRFREKSHLTKHTLIHTGEKPYKCNVCQRSFREKSHLTKHSNTHR